jgi:hypothetical protein
MAAKRKPTAPAAEATGRSCAAFDDLFARALEAQPAPTGGATQA